MHLISSVKVQLLKNKKNDDETFVSWKEIIINVTYNTKNKVVSKLLNRESEINNVDWCIYV